jgi:hypothetical protein
VAASAGLPLFFAAFFCDVTWRLRPFQHLGGAIVFLAPVMAPTTLRTKEKRRAEARRFDYASRAPIRTWRSC